MAFSRVFAACVIVLVSVCEATPGQTQVQKLIANPGEAGEGFGTSVSISGDLAVVGAYTANNGEGAAYVFRRNGGVWTQDGPALRPFDGEPWVLFGSSVAASSSPSGDVVAVGSAFAAGDPVTQPGEYPGAIYVYRKTAGTWACTKIHDPLGQSFDFFGASIAAFENVLVVGAPAYRRAGAGWSGSGAVYIYRFDGAAWALEQRVDPRADLPGKSFQFGEWITAWGGAQSERFIVSVRTDSAPNNVGAAYIYSHAGGSWSIEPGGRLASAECGAGDNFGTFPAALYGNVAVVGALLKDVGGVVDAGASYVYRFDGQQWNFERRLVAPAPATGESFGVGQTLEGNLLLVTTRGGGWTYRFRFDGVDWTDDLAPRFRGNDQLPGEAVWGTVASNGSVAFVAADSQDNQIGIDAGAVYVYEIHDTPVGPGLNVQPVDPATGAAPARLAFASVTAPGTTTIAVSDSGPALPSGFSFGTDPTFSEIATTASYVGPILLSIHYGDVYTDETNLRLLHYEGGAWVDVTTTVDVVNNLISGSVSSLSPFVVAERTTLTVPIDIKPGVHPNTINLGSNGGVPVAILSTATFDARTVDPATVSLASAGVNLRGNGTPQVEIRDVDYDGRLDLVIHVATQALQLAATDTEAVLVGKTRAGQHIRGVDTVRIVPS